MALTNSQYDYFMRMYEQRQLDNEATLRERYAQVYEKVPQFEALEQTISATSVSAARKLIDGDETAAAKLRENLHLLFEEKKRLLANAGYPQDFLEKTYTCPDCKDTGYIGDEKCHCFKKEIIEFLYTQSNLRESLETENFSTLSMEYYSPEHIDPLTGRSSQEAMKTAVKTALDFIREFPGEGRNILLYGDTGVGKTFLSHCIAKEILDRAYSVIYFTATELFNTFAKKEFDKDDEATAQWEHIYDCDLLIIDDLGTEFANRFTTSQLFVCLNERMRRKKSTIISTNLSLENIREVYSERIFSRISSGYTVLRMTGDDIRIQKKLMGRP